MKPDPASAPQITATPSIGCTAYKLHCRAIMKSGPGAGVSSVYPTSQALKVSRTLLLRFGLNNRQAGLSLSEKTHQDLMGCKQIPAAAATSSYPN